SVVRQKFFYVMSLLLFVAMLLAAFRFWLRLKPAWNSSKVEAPIVERRSRFDVPMAAVIPEGEMTCLGICIGVRAWLRRVTTGWRRLEAGRLKPC
ncbi:MAG: hypothetical protein ACREBC_26835, partial [Pyrinomonadaceae bacterium]